MANQAAVGRSSRRCPDLISRDSAVRYLLRFSGVSPELAEENGKIMSSYPCGHSSVYASGGRTHGMSRAAVWRTNCHN